MVCQSPLCFMSSCNYLLSLTQSRHLKPAFRTGVLFSRSTRPTLPSGRRDSATWQTARILAPPSRAEVWRRVILGVFPGRDELAGQQRVPVASDQLECNGSLSESCELTSRYFTQFCSHIKILGVYCSLLIHLCHNSVPATHTLLITFFEFFCSCLTYHHYLAEQNINNKIRNNKTSISSLRLKFGIMFSGA